MGFVSGNATFIDSGAVFSAADGLRRALVHDGSAARAAGSVANPIGDAAIERLLGSISGAKEAIATQSDRIAAAAELVGLAVIVADLTSGASSESRR